MAPRTRSQTAASAPVFRLKNPTEPPLYRVDLSLPPRQRYIEICSEYKTELLELQPLYDEVLSWTRFPRLFKGLARLLLRRVFAREEMEEIVGISNVTGIPKHLVIAFNTFLDLLSGCVSGGAQVTDSGPSGKTRSMVHFRGLDWGMDALRALTICVEYVRDGEVIARAVTYAGYTGILTGVRKGLSMSLNYRARLDPKSSHLHKYIHQLLLLVGRRPSTSSRLRDILLSPGPPLSLDDLKADLGNFITTPCYLTFCSCDSIMIVEKDLHTCKFQTSDSFLAVTNHDVEMESWTEEHWERFMEGQARPDNVSFARDLVADSIERKERVCTLWEGFQNSRGQDHGLRVADVAAWLEVKPLLNECTHYSCVMDPSVDGGGLLWVKAYEEAVSMDDATNDWRLPDII